MIMRAFRFRKPFLELEQMTSLIQYIEALKEEENEPSWAKCAVTVLEGDSKTELGVYHHAS